MNDVAKGALLAGAASIDASVQAIHVAADQLPASTEEQAEVLRVIRDLVVIQEWLRAVATGGNSGASNAA
jgi:hypothetical protein